MELVCRDRNYVSVRDASDGSVCPSERGDLVAGDRDDLNAVGGIVRGEFGKRIMALKFRVGRP